MLQTNFFTPFFYFDTRCVTQKFREVGSTLAPRKASKKTAIHLHVSLWTSEVNISTLPEPFQTRSEDDHQY